MSPAEYDSLCQFLLKSSGLMLGSNKEYLVESRLSPVAQSWGLNGIPELVQSLAKGAERRLVMAVMEAMTTNETSFFRDKNPFEELKTVVLPTLMQSRRGARTLRIWCAACSTGQEPYSISMLIDDYFPQLKGWKLDIFATDIDTTVLSRAADGVYSQFEVQRGMPIQLLLRHFEQLPGNAGWQIKPEHRQRISWMHLNLMENLTRVGTPDVIFCRNVLIYFENSMKKDVLNRLAQRIAPDGYLVLGAAETVLGASDAFQRLRDCKSAVYQRLPAETAAAASA